MDQWLKATDFGGLLQDQDTVRFAVSDEQNAVGKQDAVWAIQLVVKRVGRGAVADLSRSEERGDNAGLEIDFADRVAVGVGHVEDVTRTVGEALPATVEMIPVFMLTFRIT
jgi:hypothetical protein